MVQRCLDGQSGAWDDLYELFHERLCQSIRRLAGPLADANLIEEIAARVWYALVRSEFELLSRFDATRGCRLSTFLGGIARKEFAAYARAERRRRVREQAVGRPRLDVTLQGVASSREDLAEFMNSLTRTERAFCDNWLMSRNGEAAAESNSPAAVAPPISEANMRQLRHRIRRKLDLFLASR